MIMERTPLAQRVREARAGFTIVEVIVAMLILTFGVLGLAGTTVYVVRATKYGDITTERSAAVQSVIERLRSIDYDSLGNGADTVGNFNISWTTSSGTRSTLVQVVSVGPGLKSNSSGPPSIRTTVADTFQYRIVR